MKQIIVIKPKSISPKDKEKLSKNGYLVIEHDHPDEFKIIHLAPDSQTADILYAALEAISTTDYSSVNTKFVKDLTRRMKIYDTKPLPAK